MQSIGSYYNVIIFIDKELIAMTTPNPARLPCYRSRTPIHVDGNLDKSPWLTSPRSHRFVDMVSGLPGFYDTRTAALWDDQNLYVAFWVEEPQVNAEFTERDSIIFRENDIELFINGGDCYYEFEINALGTVYEVFFIWRDAFQRGSRFDRPEFDLYSRRAYSFGGDLDRNPASFWDGTHPRKTRWAFLDWDFPGLQSGVKVDGKINDPATIDKGWTVEMALPWSGMGLLAGDRACPPAPGDAWQMFLGRFQKLSAGGNEINPHPAWVLSPHGIFDTHQPDFFPWVDFKAEYVEDIPG
jgi:hypothetical protein